MSAENLAAGPGGEAPTTTPPSQQASSEMPMEPASPYAAAREMESNATTTTTQLTNEVDEADLRMERFEQHLVLLQEGVGRKFDEIVRGDKDTKAVVERTRIQALSGVHSARDSIEALERRVEQLETELGESNARVKRLEEFARGAKGREGCCEVLTRWIFGPSSSRNANLYELSDEDGAFAEGASPYADHAVSDDNELRTPLRDSADRRLGDFFGDSAD